MKMFERKMKTCSEAEAMVLVLLKELQPLGSLENKVHWFEKQYADQWSQYLPHYEPCGRVWIGFSGNRKT